MREAVPSYCGHSRLTRFYNEREHYSRQLLTRIWWRLSLGKEVEVMIAGNLGPVGYLNWPRRYTLLHTMFHCCTGEILHCCSTNFIVARNTRCCIVAIPHCWTQYTAVASHTRLCGCTLRFAVASHTIFHCRTPYLVVASHTLVVTSCSAVKPGRFYTWAPTRLFVHTLVVTHFYLSFVHPVHCQPWARYSLARVLNNKCRSMPTLGKI